MNDNSKKPSPERKMFEIARAAANLDTGASAKALEEADKAFLKKLKDEGGQKAVDEEMERRERYKRSNEKNIYFAAIKKPPSP